MEERVLALEHRMEGVEIRLGRVEDKLDRLAEAVADIRIELAKKPTTGALWGMVATMLGIALAIAALTFVVTDYASRAPGL